ncbi:tryptophan synthase subunit alpha [Thermoplasma sp.]|uniref:tryptophan synthase subunit alpha n=1 Tax=Thermoplasma sp. TaxID=1973142 RepID=UPI00127C424E|nr:tryptophan synthase subunit alpha [Thermoplasma sp.]KAA8921979.1 MAG: tryptophan synthase subunit alpha [Thermoplasma sp.]
MKPFVYFTLGYRYDTMAEFIKNSDGVYAFEFGFPTSRPIYDGVRIRRTHDPAVNKYDESANAGIFRIAEDMGSRKYALMYYDVLATHRNILDYLNRNGFNGAIIPDLMIDHGEAFQKTIDDLKDHSLDYVPFVTPITPGKVMEKQIAAGGDWIYQGMMPATGVQLPYSMDTIYSHIKPYSDGKRIVYGFGIRDSNTMRMLARYGAFGIAVGTAVVEMLDRCDISSYRSLIETIMEA